MLPTFSSRVSYNKTSIVPGENMPLKLLKTNRQELAGVFKYKFNAKKQGQFCNETPQSEMNRSRVFSDMIKK